jgi:[protein-PII] uridylyltransferase
MAPLAETVPPEAEPSPLQLLQRKKARVVEARARIADMFHAGAPGVQIATAFGDAVEQVVLEFWRDSLSNLLREEQRAVVEANCAVIAVGGTGRGELCPYSDVDLLFLDGGNSSDHFRPAVSAMVQACWDAKLQLGHSIRTLRECLALAKQDPEVATSLVEARLLWGSPELFAKFERQFRRQVVVGRKKQFLQDCMNARLTAGPQGQELEPDVKNSVGGLRDLHLLRWLGFALCGERDVDSLRLQGFLTKDQARQLRSAHEFFTRIRIDLHLHAGREQDRLTRDEQLRIAEQRGTEATAEQRPVERLMQEYFLHASEVASTTRRFADRHRPRSLIRRTRNLLVGHRADGLLHVSPDEIDALPRDYPHICRSLDSILRVFKSAALYNLPLSARLTDAIKSAVPGLSREVTPYAGRAFLDILRHTVPLGRILRTLADTQVLDLLIPDFTHIRSLMQFNQYHHFTVDEHTLRAIETVTAFEQADSPVGAAYRATRQKEVLHLALILHDIGKGFVRDHCVVGEEIALRIGPRLGMTPAQTEQVAFLVRQHLEMADTAFRRDTTDERLLMAFAHRCASPDRLRMLFVLTAADVTAVGPGVWNDWKADLLAELFDRCLLILSGKRYSFHEQDRLETVKARAVELVAPLDPEQNRDEFQRWITTQLQAFSAYYLTCTSPARIAADLDVMQRLTPESVHVTGEYNEATRTVEYRILTGNPVAVNGCFHRLCGILSAKRCEILSADINTTHSGVVVDTFRVRDTDFSGEVPQHRIDEIATLIDRVLRGEESIEELFRRNKRFGSDESGEVTSNLPPRVSIDVDSSDTRTVVDVFAHDRPGLLYRIARALHELQVSVDLAKISTNFDQVVDVFYLLDQDGSKIVDPARLEEIRTRLETTLRPPAA